MQIKEVIDDPKAAAAYARRRAEAVVQHGKTVLSTGLDAARSVAEVAGQSLRTAVQVQAATLTDRSLPIPRRVRQLRTNAINLADTARTDLTAAVTHGYRSVKDRLSRVTDVTHKEQALENKLSRKAKKLKKAVAEHIPPT